MRTKKKKQIKHTRAAQSVSFSFLHCGLCFIKNPVVPSIIRFIRVGGYRLLNSWLTYSKTTNNSPLLQLILLTLQKLPLKVDHLKQVLTEISSRMSKQATTAIKPAFIDWFISLFFSPRTTQLSWWSSWARVQRLKVSWLLQNQNYFDSVCLFVCIQLISPVFSDLRKLASVLVDGWMATIRSQSVSGSNNSPAGTDAYIILAF